MPTFDYSFAVSASQSAVAEFHHDTSVLKTLTPLPVLVKIHHFDPLGDGSEAEFTMWFGPFPVRWQVVHSHVDKNGFTDTQIRGPLKKWQHTHRFISINENLTQVREHIDYDYKDGFAGLWSRLLFSRLGLFFLFTARKIITRRQIKKQQAEAGLS